VSLGEDQAVDNEKFRRGLASVTQGMCESIDWANGLALVNVGGGTLPLPMVGEAPFEGHKVWVGFFGEQPVCLGRVARPVRGAASGTASGGRVVVIGDDGETYSDLGYLGTAPTNGQRVAIDWSGGGLVLGVPSAEATVIDPDVPAGSVPTVRTYEFRPTGSKNWYLDSGYTNGSSGNEVWCSDDNQGVYVYGNAIPDSIPDDAEFVAGSLKIYLVEYLNRFPSSLAQLGRHNLATLSGDPNPTDTTSIPDCRGGKWVTLPDRWEDNFRAGSARGVAFLSGGQHRYRAAGVENSGVIVGKWKVS
jgi:hypothetical protein